MLNVGFIVEDVGQEVDVKVLQRMLKRGGCEGIVEDVEERWM